MFICIVTFAFIFWDWNSGYLAPEYAMRGYLTEKTDVFAFGVVALEIVAGKPNCASEEAPSLLEWVRMNLIACTWIFLICLSPFLFGQWI